MTNAIVGVQKPANDNSLAAFARAVEAATKEYKERFPGLEPTHVMLSKKLEQGDIDALLEQTGLRELTNSTGDPHRYGLRVVWVGGIHEEKSAVRDGVWFERKSENLHSVKWDAEQLHVRFKSDPDTVYQHAGVTRDEFLKLCYVPSAGTYYDQNFRGKPFIKYSLSGKPVGKTEAEQNATVHDAEGEVHSVVLFVDDFPHEPPDPEASFRTAIELGMLLLADRETPATHFGLPNPGTPVSIRTWVQGMGGSMDFNHESGRQAVWVRSLATNSEGGASA